MISFKEFCRCKSIREDWGKTSPIPKEVYKFPSGEEDENSTLWDALTDRIRDVFDGININRQGNKYFRTSSAAYRETLGKLQKVVAGARQENFSAMHTGKLVMWLILLEGLFLDSRIVNSERTAIVSALKKCRGNLVGRGWELPDGLPTADEILDVFADDPQELYD